MAAPGIRIFKKESILKAIYFKILEAIKKAVRDPISIAIRSKGSKEPYWKKSLQFSRNKRPSNHWGTKEAANDL
jgi:hypothetical protein